MGVLSGYVLVMYSRQANSQETFLRKLAYSEPPKESNISVSAKHQWTWYTFLQSSFYIYKDPPYFVPEPGVLWHESARVTMVNFVMMP